MVVIEGEPGTTPTKFEHVVWRILDDIRRALAAKELDVATTMVGELEDYAITFSKRRNEIMAVRTLEDYVMTKIANALNSSRVDKKQWGTVLEPVQEFFALSVRRPIALAALAPLINMNTGVQVARLADLIPYITQHVNRILAMSGLQLRFDVEELKKLVKRGWF